jgi:hypothetical protein
MTDIHFAFFKSKSQLYAMLRDPLFPFTGGC